MGRGHIPSDQELNSWAGGGEIFPGDLEIPDLCGLTETEAREKLAESGLLAEGIVEYPGAVQEVFSQWPRAGEMVAKKTTVFLRLRKRYHLFNQIDPHVFQDRISAAQRLLPHGSKIVLNPHDPSQGLENIPHKNEDRSRPDDLLSLEVHPAHDTVKNPRHWREEIEAGASQGLRSGIFSADSLCDVVEKNKHNPFLAHRYVSRTIARETARAFYWESNQEKISALAQEPIVLHITSKIDLPALVCLAGQKHPESVISVEHKDLRALIFLRFLQKRAALELCFDLS